MYMLHCELLSCCHMNVLMVYTFLSCIMSQYHYRLFDMKMSILGSVQGYGRQSVCHDSHKLGSWLLWSCACPTSEVLNDEHDGLTCPVFTANGNKCPPYYNEVSWVFFVSKDPWSLLLPVETPLYILLCYGKRYRTIQFVIGLNGNLIGIAISHAIHWHPV